MTAFDRGAPRFAARMKCKETSLSSPTGAADAVYSMFIGLIRDANSPDEAEQKIRELVPDAASVDVAVRRYHNLTNSIIEAREPASMRDPRYLTPWYTGPRPADRYWPALERSLRAAGDLDAEAIESLDLASTKVVANLPAPYRSDFSGRGLVLGYVQSGKTGNFTAVISKAADAGYRLIVVLSGLHNNLRRQTQIRLDEQLVGLNPSAWIQLTSETADFGDPGNASAFLSQNSQAVLAVVKKNGKRLNNLLEWLDKVPANALSHCPVLIIDDEADQASVNSSKDDRTAINQLMLQLLMLPRVAYVGYTATPFANIFIDPTIEEDLYPRDFIVDLPRPAAYFGPERIFGRERLNDDDEDDAVDGLDMVMLVPDAEVAQLRPPKKKADRDAWEPEITQTLREALRWFLLATAARHARGQSQKHSSMLLHTTQLTSIHFRYREVLEAELKRAAHADERPALRRLWDREVTRVPAEILGEQPLTFDQVEAALGGVFDAARVIIDNARSEERLDYGDPGQVVVVVGGNTLSRGLTLEGLVVSYFLRTASAYDTLLQMGRWFGYRGGYADLPRIWTTAEMAEYFQFLALVEAEIRLDVARYEAEDMRPDQFAVRVRTHPFLGITSALKMGSAEKVYVSYSGRRLQTILFEHHNREWLRANMQAGRELIATVGGAATASPAGEDGRVRWSGVDVAAIKRFLRSYRFHPDAKELVADRILAYIAKQNVAGELLEWNVALVARPASKGRVVNMGSAAHPLNVGAINRAAVKVMARPHANIKSLMSRQDRVMDLDLDRDEVANSDDAALQALRPKDIGLLILYPIDPKSKPRNAETGTRVPLDAVDDVLGVGMVFPDSRHKDDAARVAYMSVGLELGDVEEFDDDDGDGAGSADELDTEDSLNGVDV